MKLMDIIFHKMSQIQKTKKKLLTVQKKYQTMMEEFELIGWPEIQFYMELEGFKENSTLVDPNTNIGIDSSTYLVSKSWLDSLNNK